MALHIIMKDYDNQTQEYDLPCADGKLSEINAITSGTKTDKFGKAWTITRTDTGNGHQLDITLANNQTCSYDLATLMEDAMPSIGITINHYAHALTDYIPDAFTSLKYLIPLDRTQQYPCMSMSKTGPSTSGRYGDRYSGYFTFKPTSTSRSYSWDSYKFYNSAHTQVQAIRTEYGALLGLETTSGLGDIVFGDINIAQTDNLSSYGYQIRIYFNFDVNGANWGMPDYEAGDKGFKPTGSGSTKPNKPGVGGRGSSGKIDPDYAADQIFQPGAPIESSASAVNSGFLNLYKMSQAELNKVCACLYSDNLFAAIANLTINPLDFIVSLMVFPCSPDVGSSEQIKLGKWLCSAATGVIGALGTDMSGTRVTSQYKVFDFGTLAIPETWGSFLDYTQTDIELYLPFIGSVEIDPSECMGGTINVAYTVDFFTGMCVANVLCSRPNATLPNGKALSHVQAQHSYQGNCAAQIPLSAEAYGSMVGSLINACCKTVSNPVGGLISLSADFGNMVRPNVSTKGNIVANSGFCSVLYPYVRLTRPITAEPESYQEVVGYPSYINTTIGQCDDLCVCKEIDLKGITGATDDELDEIRRLCLEGVRN